MPDFPPPLPPGGFVSLPHRGDMWVWDSGGPGPTVVLLHGWTSTAALNWSPSMLALANDFRVVAPDHRGHGRGIQTRRFTLEDCADDVAALVKYLGVGPVIAAGYSMGGPVAELIWRRHRDVVAGMVLCATAASFPGRADLAPAITAVGLGLSALAAALPNNWRAQAFARMNANKDPNAERARWFLGEHERSDPGAIVQAGAAISAFDARGWISTIDVPVSVIVTEHDQTVLPERQLELAASIPGAELTMVPGGHRACVERSDAFVPALIEACRSVRERART